MYRKDQDVLKIVSLAKIIKNLSSVPSQNLNLEILVRDLHIKSRCIGISIKIACFPINKNKLISNDT